MVLSECALDLEILVVDYAEKETTSFDEFAQLWTSRKFSFIHYARPINMTTRDFSSALYAIVLDRFVASAPLHTKVGLLYTLLALDESDPERCARLSREERSGGRGRARPRLCPEGMRTLLSVLREASRHDMPDVLAAVKAMMERNLLEFGAVPMALPLMDAEGGVDRASLAGGSGKGAARGRDAATESAKQDLRRALKKAEVHLERRAQDDFERLQETEKVLADYVDARRHLFVWSLKTEEPVSLLPSIKDPTVEEVGLAAPSALHDARDALHDFRLQFWAECSRQAEEASREMMGGAATAPSQNRPRVPQPRPLGGGVGMMARLLARVYRNDLPRQEQQPEEEDSRPGLLGATTGLATGAAAGSSGVSQQAAAQTATARAPRPDPDDTGNGNVLQDMPSIAGRKRK